MSFIYAHISENRQIIIIQMQRNNDSAICVWVCKFSFCSQRNTDVWSGLMFLPKPWGCLQGDKKKKYIEERRKHKMVENFPGLIKKSNYRGSWTRVLVVATIVLEIAMTRHFMAQQYVTNFWFILSAAEMNKRNTHQHSHYWGSKQESLLCAQAHFILSHHKPRVFRSKLYPFLLI